MGWEGKGREGRAQSGPELSWPESKSCAELALAFAGKL
jgi:hypothetical protein